MAPRRVEIRVVGGVQGVFFRQGVKAEATRLSIVGWVRIVADGEETRLQELIDWCRKGTEGARVEKMDVQRREATGEWDTFEIK